MSGSLTRGGGENVPGIRGTRTIRKFSYLARCTHGSHDVINWVSHIWLHDSSHHNDLVTCPPRPWPVSDMFAVVGRGLYAEADPLHFGNIIKALFTLFQLLTLDDWFDIYRGVANADPGTVFKKTCIKRPLNYMVSQGRRSSMKRATGSTSTEEWLMPTQVQ